MIFNMYAQTVSRIPCRFIYADVLVPVSEVVVVVILCEWWSVPITANTSLPLDFHTVNSQLTSCIQATYVAYVSL